jgi:hypothetical protein
MMSCTRPGPAVPVEQSCPSVTERNLPQFRAQGLPPILPAPGSKPCRAIPWVPPPRGLPSPNPLLLRQARSAVRLLRFFAAIQFSITYREEASINPYPFYRRQRREQRKRLKREQEVHGATWIGYLTQGAECARMQDRLTRHWHRLCIRESREIRGSIPIRFDRRYSDPDLNHGLLGVRKGKG